VKALPYERAALIGTGLIGGSLLLALREAGAVRSVVGYDRSPEVGERARARGILDEVAGSPGDAVAGADLVILAVPVCATGAVCDLLAPSVGREVLVTDVGSTKREVQAAVERALPFPERFVGAHPMAGTERSGPDAADGALFRGRRCLVVPASATRRDAVEACVRLWQAAGATVEELAAEAHDRVVGWVSHLPHLASFALAAAVGEAARGAPGLLEGLSGGGYLDTTRIAASDPVMWRDVLLSNRDVALAALDQLDEELGALRRAIARGDGPALEALIGRARAGRRRILEGKR
jgi:cyclohexadieny/prephenate dehydrogenase